MLTSLVKIDLSQKLRKVVLSSLLRPCCLFNCKKSTGFFLWLYEFFIDRNKEFEIWIYYTSKLTLSVCFCFSSNLIILCLCYRVLSSKHNKVLNTSTYKNLFLKKWFIRWLTLYFLHIFLIVLCKYSWARSDYYTHLKKNLMA